MDGDNETQKRVASSDGCGSCSFRNSGLCAVVIGINPGTNHCRKIDGAFRARQHVYRAGEAPGRIMVLREGWAAKSAFTPDGKRQVLSILLPGDTVGGELVMRSEARTHVQALTPIKYCAFDIDELMASSKDEPKFVWALVGLCSTSREASESRLVDLGRRNAAQRIVSFILEVFERLTKRGLADGATIPFPLRQHIIADALGLTQVHVSRIITALRNRGAIRLSGGKLTILDMGALLSDV